MRVPRQPTLASAIALPLALLACFSIYVFKTPKTNPSPPLFPFHRANYTPSSPLPSSALPIAPPLSPAALMARPLPTSASHIPKLLHQSWSTTTLPSQFQQWSLSCRETNPDFEWVLWTDEDNRRLVEKYAPEFLASYDGLKSEIYRADAVRNLYMFIFGGIYADLDTECLRPYSSLFAQQNITSVSHPSAVPIPPTTLAPSTLSPPPAPPPPPTALLARMGTDPTKKHSIPNAFMSSPPTHPFFLLPLALIASPLRPYGTWPEAVTGPDALFFLVNKYLSSYSGSASALDEYLQTSEMKSLYLRRLDGGNAGVEAARLVVLGHEAIFPYWWGQKELEGICRAGSEGFDTETCKDVLGVEAKGSWSITYWSHSWKEEGGHDEGYLGRVRRWGGRLGGKR